MTIPTTEKTVKEEIDQVLANIQGKMSSYRDRPAQKIMIAEVAKNFWNAKLPEEGCARDSQNIIAIEAKTGTGKSQSYLIPSILVGRRKAKRVVVSSATVKLQQQLCDTELPRLNDCIEGGITYMIAKGRRRYVCPSRLEKEAGGASQMSLAAESRGSKTDDRDTQIITLHKRLQKREWDGERDSVRVDDALWQDISTDSNGCTGKKCSKYNECPFVEARAKLSKVDVIVVNHDLLLSDLNLGGGMILTEPEETFYVLDEGHHLPDKTLSAFASQYSATSTLRMVEKMAIDHGRSAPGSLSNAIHENAEVLHRYLADMSEGLEMMDSLKKAGDMLRFPFGVMPDTFSMMGDNIMSSAETLITSLANYYELLEEQAKEGETSDKQEKELMETAVYIDRAQSIHTTWLMLMRQPKEHESPIAKWIEVVPSGRDVDYVLSASPVSAAEVLKRAFWDRALGVVVTSATLTALGRFDLFLEQSGLSLIPDQVKSISLPTPFDYQRQGKLVVPKMKFSPKDVVGHTAEVIEKLPAYYPDKDGMLVLFTSRKQMTEVRDALPAHLQEMTMMQGDISMSEIIDRHKERIDSGLPNCIFGLASLAEGVDLPSNYCVRVIVVKLPFDVPSDPISKSYSEWLEANDRNPFYEVSLPSASRKLNQWSGRLIRTESDVGEVVCFDNRLSTSKYGKQLIASLPPYQLEIA